MNELTRDKYLLPDEESQLLQTLHRFRTREARDVLLLDLLYVTGMRISEVVGLRKSDLDIAHSSIYVRATKKSKHRELPLPLSIVKRLNDLSGPLLFPMTTRNVERIWHLYRPALKGIHSLRHTAAINLYKKTRDIKLVQLFLGHRSLTNTQIYLDFVYSQEHLRSHICLHQSLFDSTNYPPSRTENVAERLSSATEFLTSFTPDI